MLPDKLILMRFALVIKWKKKASCLYQHFLVEIFHYLFNAMFSIKNAKNTSDMG